MKLSNSTHRFQKNYEAFKYYTQISKNYEAFKYSKNYEAFKYKISKNYKNYKAFKYYTYTLLIIEYTSLALYRIQISKRFQIMKLSNTRFKYKKTFK